jgi:hypothetical protein
MLASADYVYAATTCFADDNNPPLVPTTSALITIDLATGALVSAAPLGDQSAASLSTDNNGRIYVPSKPFQRGGGLFLEEQGQIPTGTVAPAAAGVFAFEPASWLDLSRNGIEAARHLLAAGDVARAITQAEATTENIDLAHDRGEVGDQAQETATDALRNATTALTRLAAAGCWPDACQPLSALAALVAELELTRALGALS